MRASAFLHQLLRIQRRACCPQAKAARTAGVHCLAYAVAPRRGPPAISDVMRQVWEMHSKDLCCCVCAGWSRCAVCESKNVAWLSSRVAHEECHQMHM